MNTIPASAYIVTAAIYALPFLFLMLAERAHKAGYRK